MRLVPMRHAHRYAQLTQLVNLQFGTGRKAAWKIANNLHKNDDGSDKLIERLSSVITCV